MKWRGGIGIDLRSRGHMISWRSYRYKGMGSSSSFKYYRGPRKILIGGWRILGYGGTGGFNLSHLISTSCRVDLRLSREISRQPYHKRNTTVGSTLLLRKGAN